MLRIPWTSNAEVVGADVDMGNAGRSGSGRRGEGDERVDSCGEERYPRAEDGDIGELGYWRGSLCSYTKDGMRPYVGSDEWGDSGEYMDGEKRSLKSWAPGNCSETKGSERGGGDIGVDATDRDAVGGATSDA